MIYDKSCTDHFSWPCGLGFNEGVLSGSYQVMLVSPDMADPRCIGSHLYLPASISVVAIPDPQIHSMQVILLSLLTILKHLRHHPQSSLNHISRHGQRGINIYYYSF